MILYLCFTCLLHLSATIAFASHHNWLAATGWATALLIAALHACALNAERLRVDAIEASLQIDPYSVEATNSSPDYVTSSDASAASAAAAAAAAAPFLYPRRMRPDLNLDEQHPWYAQAHTLASFIGVGVSLLILTLYLATQCLLHHVPLLHRAGTDPLLNEWTAVGAYTVALKCCCQWTHQIHAWRAKKHAMHQAAIHREAKSPTSVAAMHDSSEHQENDALSPIDAI